jgi:hypothetical protein
VACYVHPVDAVVKHDAMHINVETSVYSELLAPSSKLCSPARQAKFT